MSDQPGNAQFSNETPPNIPDYLYLSIFATLCCCLPFGIIGIINAMNVKKYVAEGKYDLAEKASKSAKMWVFIGIGLGLVINIAVFALNFLGAILSSR